MKRIVLAAAAALCLAGVSPAGAAEGVITYKSLNPDTALDLARAALQQCRKDGYQVTVVVVDRFGQTLVLLRDRFAGMVTETVATRKALTALNFSRDTSEVQKMFKSGELGPEYNRLPNILPVSGGLVIQAGGSTLGAVGVSGGPPGNADETCAKAGLAAVQDKLEF
jgi:uncharacterized protein GlcG (DUF336 family)